MKPTRSIPPAEVEITEELVHRLIASQFPEWAALPVEATPTIGWDNILYRLGADLVVRLPRRQVVADVVGNEHRWLPVLAPQLPVAIPVPVGQGRPGDGYPWCWSVCPWIPGEMAAVAAISDFNAFALQLGAFLSALHVEAPADGPRSTHLRCGPLLLRDESTRDQIKYVARLFDPDRLAAAWDQALDVEPWRGPDVWIHGDLHQANLIVEDGQLSGVVDFVDVGVGDPGVDLLTAWMLLPADARPVLRASAGVDQATWDRGRGWALSISLMFVSVAADNPVINDIGLQGIEAVLADSSA
jgi:aminoglycoside phosphotransferase (APT) family kinase protein